MSFYEKLKSRKLRVCVLGVGYVGLPLIREFMSKKFNVTGFDIDPHKVKLFNSRKKLHRFDSR